MINIQKIDIKTSFLIVFFGILNVLSINAQFNTIKYQNTEVKVNENKELDKKVSDKKLIKKTKKDSVPLTGIMNKSDIFCLPVSDVYITSPYGMRKHPVTKEYSFHNGIDLRGKNVPVRATMNGKIKKVSYTKKSGINIILESGDFTFSYSHLSHVYLKKGTKVLAGRIIGRSGNTGLTTAPHLHFSVKYKKNYLNPYSFIKYVTSFIKEE